MTQDLWTLFAAVMRGEGGLSEEAYFEQLYRQYYRSLVGFAAGCAGTHNIDRVPAHLLHPEELVHEAFVTLYDRRYSVRNPRPFVFETIRSLARNRASDAVRKSQAAGALKRELLYQAIGRRRRGGRLIPADIRKVRVMVKRLPAGMRSDIEARFYLGLSFDEIAESRGVTKNAVVKSIRRALKKLEGLLIGG